MATGKRFYWMKLKESFMTSDTIDYFMSQPDGANYVVLYQMLCLKTINTGGRFCRQIGEVVIPYDVEKIVRDCKWFSADTVRVALDLYMAFGLIYRDEDGVMVMANHADLVGSETDWAAKKQRQRLGSGENVPALVPSPVPKSVPTDIRDKRLDIRDKRIENRDNDKETGGVPPAPAEEAPVCSLILNDGSFFNVTAEQVRKWEQLYPAVNVPQELRKMVGWCDANPKKRKTKSGVMRFCNSWLAKEQDRGGSRSQLEGGAQGGNGEQPRGNSGKGWNLQNDLAD